MYKMSLRFILSTRKYCFESWLSLC